MESAALFAVSETCAARAAASIEMLHAYSLVHDDLPAMDDDDLRRGKPSTHKAFDEATAILAGDALQARAFEVLAEPDTHSDPQARCELVAALGGAAGARGMAGGQMIDMLAEGRTLDGPAVTRLQALKTGRLIQFSAEAGAILGRAPLAQTAPSGRLWARPGSSLPDRRRFAGRGRQHGGDRQDRRQGRGRRQGDDGRGPGDRTGALAGRVAGAPGRRTSGWVRRTSGVAAVAGVLRCDATELKFGVGERTSNESCEHAVVGPRPLSGGSAQFLSGAIARACGRIAGGDDRCGFGDRRASGRLAWRGGTDGRHPCDLRHAARPADLGCRPSGLSAQDFDRTA